MMHGQKNIKVLFSWNKMTRN